MSDTKSEAKYSRCSNAQCSGIILADTEDWSRPLCHACWQDIGEPDVEPFNKYSELKEFWVLKENVKNGDVPAGPEKPDYSELFYHTVEKSAYSYAVDQWDYWVEEARKAQAKHERVLQMLEIAKVQLEGCRGAMAYAYEDRCDQYYLNVAENIIETLAQIESLK